MTVGKKATRLRAKIGYEHDVPACDRCRFFNGRHLQLVNSTPQWHPHRCTKHRIVVEARGCCDDWVDRKTGETLA